MTGPVVCQRGNRNMLHDWSIPRECTATVFTGIFDVPVTSKGHLNVFVEFDGVGEILCCLWCPYIVLITADNTTNHSADHQFLIDLKTFINLNASFILC